MLSRKRFYLSFKVAHIENRLTEKETLEHWETAFPGLFHFIFKCLAEHFKSINCQAAAKHYEGLQNIAHENMNNCTPM